MAKKIKEIGKTYTKTHTSDKAVASHEKNIKKRDGKIVSKIKTASKTSLVYGF